MKNIFVSGINGRMGRLTAQIIADNSEYNLIGAIGKKGSSYIGKNLGELLNISKFNQISINDDLSIINTLSDVDLIVDFTNAENCVQIAKLATSLKIPMLTGTSGITQDLLLDIKSCSNKFNSTVLIIPNFSIGACLMIEFANIASRYFEFCEITETHDPKKIDAPSGTAFYTVNKIEVNNSKKFNPRKIEEKELMLSARGAQSKSGIRIHSRRLPGIISHQEVVFAGLGEHLKLEHSSFNNHSFVDGIIYAINNIDQVQGCVVGLENIMKFN